MKHLLPLMLFVVACETPKGSKVDLGTAEDGQKVSVTVQVRGLLGAGLQLQLNGVGNLSVAANGAHAFAVSLDAGADYVVSVLRQPLLPSQACEVIAGRGTAGSEDISDVIIDCVTSKFALGGSLTGLVGSGLQLGIAGQTLPVLDNGSFTFSERVADLSDYQVDVVAQPTAPRQICLVQNGIGRIVGKAADSVRVECRTTVEPAFARGAGWNDYVTRSASWLATPEDASACDATAQTAYDTCLHGGEVRSFSFARGSCEGLRMSDALGVFDWICHDPDPSDATTPVRAVSKRLLPGKSLRDLLDLATLTFKPNVVSVVDAGGTTVATSAASVWWSTPIQQGGPFDVPGTIHVVSGTDAVSVLADRTAVIADLTASVSVVGRSFIWIEGNVSAAGATDGVLVQDARFVVLRGLNVEAASTANVHVTGGGANALFDVVSTGAAYGVDLGSTFGLAAERIIALRQQNNGLRLSGVSTSRFDAVQAIAGATGSVGISLEGSSNNDLSAVRTNNHIGKGIVFDASHHNRVTRLTSSNNAGALVVFDNANGNWLSGVSAVLGPTGFLSTGSQGNVVEQAVTLANVRFVACSTGSLSLRDQVGFPSAPTGDCTLDLSGPTGPTNNSSFQASFIGPVGINDAANAVDANGEAFFVDLEGARGNWYAFRNTFRAWGPSTPSSFLHPVQHRECSTGKCRIYDWSLKPSAAELLRGRFPAPSETREHEWTGADEALCATINGAVFTGTCTSTYLAHAHEVSGDLIGNDNGLCESSETCLTAPNIASYQGYGAGTASTIDPDGALDAITLIAPISNDGTQP